MAALGEVSVELLPRGWRSKLLTSFGWDICMHVIRLVSVHREGGPCRTSELGKLDTAVASAKYRFIEGISVSYLI